MALLGAGDLIMSKLKENLILLRQGGARTILSTARFRSLLLVFASVLFGVQTVSSVDSPVSREFQIKAAFLYNFTKFVEWPAGKFQETNSPLIIGVAGSSPMTAAIEAIVKDRQINGRPIVVKAVQTREAAQATHLLFIPSSEDSRLESLLPSGAASGVLTVGESEKFASDGGMIHFITEGGKLRFEINMGIVEQAGLQISAQLQKLAKAVRREK